MAEETELVATCPNCHSSTRTEPECMSVSKALNAKPLGTFSVAGAQTKTVAIDCLKLECRCGWSILGYIHDNVFNGWPDTQTYPDERLP